MPRPKIDYNEIAGQKPNRIEELSDGVFSIAMTLLVLDLKVPAQDIIHSEGDIWQALGRLTPSLISYALGFMTLGIFWVGQSTQFSYIERSNRGYAWIHIFFLLAVGLMPFTTSFLNAHIQYKTAIAVYYGNLVLAGWTLYISLVYAERYELTNFERDNPEHQAVMIALKRRLVYSQALYMLGASLCFFNTYLSIGFILLVQLNYALGISDWKRK